MKKFFIYCLFSGAVITLYNCGANKEDGKSSIAVYDSAIQPVQNGLVVAEEQIMDVKDINKETENPNTELYAHVPENSFLAAASEPISTFSADVDRASYSNIRRFLNQGQAPPPDAVRIEEMINYFTYEYAQPGADHPLNVVTELAQCPWNEGNQLLLVAMQAKRIPDHELPPSNLVFLVDVSGSMSEELPLVKQSFRLLTDQLKENDRVAIVVYAGAAGCVLPSTAAADKETILDAVDELEAGGSTAGGEGIKLAYKIAEQNFIKGGNNRVILATDGDFNVGVSGEKELEQLVAEKRESGVFLTCLGFGEGNYQDAKMEVMADKGNGNYSYIDNIQEAEKVLRNEFRGTMFTVAKDVKLQIQFNPENVKAYRLVGYENRVMKKEDFENDKKDAGEVGSGHTVTAIYEIIPAGTITGYRIDEQGKKTKINALDVIDRSAVGLVKLRYKKPAESVSTEIKQSINKAAGSFRNASENLRFASAVALGGMMLKNSAYKGKGTMEFVIKTAENAGGKADIKQRQEFVSLMKSVKFPS